MNGVTDNFNYHFTLLLDDYKNLEKRNDEQWYLLNRIGGCTNIKQVKALLDEHYKL